MLRHPQGEDEEARKMEFQVDLGLLLLVLGPWDA